MDESGLHVAINAQLVSFAQTYRNAGVSRYTYTLLAGLAAADSTQRYAAFVSSTEADAARASAPAANGHVRIIAGSRPTGSPPRRILWEQFALPGLLRGLRADVFHSPVNVLPPRVPCASVVTIHDLAFMRYPHYFRPARRLYQQRFTRRSARAASLVVTVSNSTKRDLMAYFGVPEERIRVIYPAIDPDFQPTDDPAVKADFRSRNGLPSRYLLFLGTLEPRKNLLTLVEAYAKLRALDGTAPPLVIAGAKGWYYEAIFERVRSLGLEGSITFAGYVAREEQPLWYACAELFVYPSVYEGFGLPVAEALACGTPTLTSSVSSLPEAGGAVALQVDPGSQDALARAMLGLLEDSTARARVEEDGPRWARQFSAARMATAYVDVYREAAGRRSDGSGKRGR
jgi:glycosyltransferase involved in cell wall biosynthesis